jgi:predicted HicB family RNase H-like nuclease
MRDRTLTRQLVVRVSDEMHDALQRDADAHGRTVAQSVRFHLRRAMEAPDA